MADKLIECYYEDHEGQLQKLDIYAEEMQPFFINGVETPLTTTLLSQTYSDDYRVYCNWHIPVNGDGEYYFAPIPSVMSYQNPYYIGWSAPGTRGQLSIALENRIIEYKNWIQTQGVSRRNFIRLDSASDRSKMFYETGTFDDTPPADPYIGQELTFVKPEGGEIDLQLCLFVRDDMEGGQLVPYGYVGGLHTIDPPRIIGANGNQYRPTKQPYNAQKAPAVGFWWTTVHCDRDSPMPVAAPWRLGGDGDMYDQDIEMLVVVLANNDNYSVTFVPMSAFYAVDAGEPTTDSPEGTNITPTGWTGAWDFTSDHDQPKSTTGYGWANLWTHGLRLYSLTSAEVGVFLEEMWNFSILKMLKQKWSELTKGDNFDWLRGIITLHILPCTVGAGEEKTITIFGQKIGNAKGHLITKDSNFQHVVTVESNDLEIPHTIDENVFLDYDGCSAYLMLPFIGQISIDVKRFRGGHIKVEYKIDILTGNCIARVYAASKKLPGQFADDSGKQILIYQGTGNCSIPIPYCGNTEGGFKQLGAIAGIGMAAAGIVTGTAPLTMAGAAGAVSELTQAPQNTERHSYTASEGSGLMYPDVKLVIEGPFPQIPERQRIDYGYAAFQTAKISSFRDYPGKQPGQKEFLQGKVHADITGATAAEKAEIERLFERGVMI